MPELDLRYAGRATHYVGSTEWWLRSVKYEDGVLVSAHVINGDWFLVRQGDQWAAQDHEGELHNMWDYEEYDVTELNREEDTDE